MKMRRNGVSKRRRPEKSADYTTDSTEDGTVSDGDEYYHEAKGKRKIRGDDLQGLQEEEEEEGEGDKLAEKDEPEKVVLVCGICLTEEEVERGKLDCCDHYFCFGCIMEWAKVESRCPTCKQRFVTVVRPSVPGMARSRPRTFHIPLRNQVYEPSEEEIRLFTDPYLHVVCTECQEAGDEHLLLLCDRCDAAAHTYCVGLGRSVPRGDWFCNMCSTQDEGEGLNSDEQEEDEEYSEEQETAVDEEDSNPLLSVLVADVQPVQRRRPTRRRASVPRVVHRHTRLHPAPAISLEAQAPTPSNHEPARSSSESSDVESTPGAARTLSSQRLLRQRVNDIRNNWDQLRRGELQFGSISRSAPTTRASQAQGRPVANTSEVAPLSDDISQAWTMMERARGLGAIPDPGSGTRASGNRGGRIPTGGEEGSVGSSRVGQIQDQTDRPGFVGGIAQLVDNTSGGHRDQIFNQTLRRSNLRDSSRAAESRLRRHRDHSSEDRSSRRESTREDNHVVETRHQRDQRVEHNFREEYARESNRVVEGSTTGGHRGSRRNNRQGNDSVQDVQGDRLYRGGNEEVGSVVPGSSGENERVHVADRSGRKTQAEEEGAHRPRHRRSSTERRDMKEQVAQYVKAELKPLYRLGHIDKQQHIRIARMATQELLAAFGIEHVGPETRAFGSASSACNHMSSASTSSLVPNCCMQCVRHNVNKVVGVLVKKVVGAGFL